MFGFRIITSAGFEELSDKLLVSRSDNQNMRKSDGVEMVEGAADELLQKDAKETTTHCKGTMQSVLDKWVQDFNLPKVTPTSVLFVPHPLSLLATHGDWKLLAFSQSRPVGKSHQLKECFKHILRLHQMM